ncbi:uncharacterized protein LOC105637321 isoform X2 [Jatropha curcas]|uniref:uncharacterized protein LOC105637321 isoform X2 n=1 Tax=Jatropha curcas TaxID=180498 RepID=UPI001895F56B|nr:uncharacterized protein LOC105637321 isoform X2 [Jatropha curcas]
MVNRAVTMIAAAVVLWEAAVMVDVCWCSNNENMMENAKKTVNDANEAYGLKQGHAREVETMDPAVSDSDWASDVKDAMARGMEYGRTRISNANEEEAKRETETLENIPVQNGGDAIEALEGPMGYGSCDEMDDFYQSINKVGEAYRSSKETMSGEAKAKYESAKERMSKATGAVGDEMRKEAAEV